MEQIGLRLEVAQGPKSLLRHGRITSSICPHCGSREVTDGWTFTSIVPKVGNRSQRHFSDSIDIKDVLQDYLNLVEFLISLGHLCPHVGIA